jgi:hypothetical protein
MRPRGRFAREMRGQLALLQHLRRRIRRSGIGRLALPPRRQGWRSAGRAGSVCRSFGRRIRKWQSGSCGVERTGARIRRMRLRRDGSGAESGRRTLLLPLEIGGGLSWGVLAGGELKLERRKRTSWRPALWRDLPAEQRRRELANLPRARPHGLRSCVTLWTAQSHMAPGKQVSLRKAVGTGKAGRTSHSPKAAHSSVEARIYRNSSSRLAGNRPQLQSQIPPRRPKSAQASHPPGDQQDDCRTPPAAEQLAQGDGKRPELAFRLTVGLSKRPRADCSSTGN